MIPSKKWAAISRLKNFCPDGGLLEVGKVRWTDGRSRAMDPRVIPEEKRESGGTRVGYGFRDGRNPGTCSWNERTTGMFK